MNGAIWVGSSLSRPAARAPVRVVKLHPSRTRAPASMLGAPLLRPPQHHHQYTMVAHVALSKVPRLFASA